MNPHAQLKWTIIAALLMWAPAAIAGVTGHIDILRSGLTFVGALIFSYIGMSIVAYLINNYQRTQQMVIRAQQEIEYIERRNAEMAEEDDENQRRRAEDS